MGKIADWFGNNWKGLVDTGLSIWNTIQGNKNIDRSLEYQSRENEKTRQHNILLADKQNAAAIAQWNRENAYNSPAAQKARYESAGLNADAMYGGISNTASASPAMAGSAPAQSVDWSSLAGKKTLGDAASDALNREFMRTQIDNVKADTQKTLADAGLSKISLEYADAEKRLGLKMSEQQYENSKKDYELSVQAIQRGEAELEGITLDNAYKAIRNAFESETFQLQIKQMSEQLKITTEQAKHAAEYYAAQLLGLQADNAWKDAAWIVQQKEGVPTLIKTGAEIVPELIMNFTSWLKPGKKKGKKSNKLTQNGNVLEWN